MDETVYGFVYKLVFVKPVDDFYVRSTTQTLYTRKAGHVNHSRTSNTNKCRAIREHGDFNLEILVPATHYKNIEALRQKEREFIELLRPTLNMCSAYRTEEERLEYSRKRSSTSNLERAICSLCDKEMLRCNLKRHTRTFH